MHCSMDAAELFIKHPLKYQTNQQIDNLNLVNSQLHTRGYMLFSTYCRQLHDTDRLEINFTLNNYWFDFLQNKNQQNPHISRIIYAWTKWQM